MSCYFRHLKDIFTEAGIEVNSGNRKQLDQTIHQLVGTNYKERQEFIIKLKNAVK